MSVWGFVGIDFDCKGRFKALLLLSVKSMSFIMRCGKSLVCFFAISLYHIHVSFSVHLKKASSNVNKASQ